MSHFLGVSGCGRGVFEGNKAAGVKSRVKFGGVRGGFLGGIFTED